MTNLVVPFSGRAGKTRLQLPSPGRRSLAVAMLGDVLAACGSVGRTYLATDDSRAAGLASAAGAEVVSLGARRGKGAALRRGFAEIGLRRGYYQPSGVDAIVMRRDLTRERTS